MPHALHNSIFAAIVAFPEDDGPRLGYADRLRQRGDPRGDLITVQCALACLGDGEGDDADERADERAELQTRQWALIDEFGPEWLAEVGLKPGEGEFHRYPYLATSIDPRVARRGSRRPDCGDDALASTAVP